VFISVYFHEKAVENSLSLIKSALKVSFSLASDTKNTFM
jgi:hypothetical protein